MEKTKKSSSDLEQHIVNLTIQLIDLLLSTEKITYKDISQLFFKSFRPDLEEERSLVWEIIDSMHASNPQVSDRLIFTILIENLVGIVLMNPYGSSSDDIREKAREKIRELLHYASIRDIDIPLVFLEVDSSPFKIGLVEFHSITEEDRKSEWWEKVKINYPGNNNLDVLSYGRILAPGDREMAIDHAERTLRMTLQFLRGIGFPIIAKHINHFGILNENIVWENFPLWLHKPNESVPIERSSQVVTRIGPLTRPYKLVTELLKFIDHDTLSFLGQLLAKEEDNLALNEMERKLLSGIRWLGEATKPDSLSARFLKVATALECLIGGEPSEENLTTRGITAMLAERAAFVVGDDKDSRMDIDREVRKYYQMRSGIVHGGDKEVSGDNFEKFGALVRRIALSLVIHLPENRKIDDLQKWVIKQRYT